MQQHGCIWDILYFNMSVIDAINIPNKLSIIPRWMTKEVISTFHNYLYTYIYTIFSQNVTIKMWSVLCSKGGPHLTLVFFHLIYIYKEPKFRSLHVCINRNKGSCGKLKSPLLENYYDLHLKNLINLS
jgi:hypothetical protein